MTEKKAGRPEKRQQIIKDAPTIVLGQQEPKKAPPVSEMKPSSGKSDKKGK